MMAMKREKILQLADMIKNSKYLVFFTGAGVSTDSGLKSFRGKDGLYHSLYKGKYPPEEILSIGFFNQQKDIFMEYIEQEMSIHDIRPNKGHEALAYLEKRGILKAVITQNIDDLHQMAGNEKVVELHGSLKRWYCLSCGKKFSRQGDCSCGGVVRPEVTLYGEMLNEKAVQEAIHHLQCADTLVIAGTSLTVYPAAYYIEYFQGKNIVILNKEETQYDKKATLSLYENFAEIMQQVREIIEVQN